MYLTICRTHLLNTKCAFTDEVHCLLKAILCNCSRHTAPVGKLLYDLAQGSFSTGKYLVKKAQCVNKCNYDNILKAVCTPLLTKTEC